MIAVAVLLALVLLRWGLLFLGAVFIVPRVRDCPACFRETLLLHRPWLGRLVPWLEWRWCPTCGWQGPSRQEESELVPTPMKHAGGSTRSL